MTDLVRVVVLTSAVVLMGCGVNPPEACTPGITASCVGSNKCEGTRLCNAQGSAFEDCICASPVDSGVGGGGGSVLGGGTGGSLGGGTGGATGGSGGGPVGGGVGGGTVTGGGIGGSGGGTTGGGAGGGTTTGGGTGGGTTGGGTGGGTPNPCAGITCTTPPATTCASASTRRTYSSPGTCSAGTCNYTFTDFTCTFGCSGGACNADPCSGITCTALDQCHDVGTCTAGVCSNPLKAAGSSCNDGNLCTLSDTCNVAGACVSGTTMTCPAPSGVCQVAACNPSTGVCGSSNAPENAACGTVPFAGVCRSGACVQGVVGANCVGSSCSQGTCDNVTTSGTFNRCMACGTVGLPCCQTQQVLIQGDPLSFTSACRQGFPSALCCVPKAPINPASVCQRIADAGVNGTICQ